MKTDRYNKCKAAGICPRCGKPARKGKVYCAACAEIKRQNDSRLYEQMKVNRANGLCGCGAKPAAGYKMCRFCRTKQVSATKRYLAKKSSRKADEGGDL